MYCATNPFLTLNLSGPHNKPHGVRGLGKHYHMRFYTKIVNGTYSIHCIPCACTLFTYSLDQPWIPGIPAEQQPCYQHIKYCTYWPVLGSFDNWNIIKLSHKGTSSEEVYKTHQVVLDRVSDNMSTLLKTGQYGAIGVFCEKNMTKTDVY